MTKLQRFKYGKFDTRDLFNLFSTIATSIKQPHYVNTLPWFLYIEPTNRCNLTCEMCNVNKNHTDNHCDLDIEQFTSILYQLPDVKFIFLVGNGEPLLNKDIITMIKLAKKRKIVIGLVTNGMLLDENLARQLLDSAIDWISFSIDSPYEEHYEEIRKGGDFKRVVQNIKKLVELRKDERFGTQSNIPYLSLNFVAMANNIEELPEVIKLAYFLHIKKVNVLQVQFIKGNYDWFRDHRVIGNVSEIKAKTIRIKAIKEARKFDVFLNFSTFFYPKKTKRRCRVPWISAYITSRGEVCPCACLDGSVDNIIFGNVFRDRFFDIWNNNEYQSFRAELKNNCIPTPCRGCAWYTAPDCLHQLFFS